MKTFLESPVTAQAELATVHATAMMRINNGINHQGSATPDSNSSAEEKERLEQQPANSVQTDVEALKTQIFTQLNNGIEVDYFDFIRIHGKFAYLENNRSIDENHVQIFVESFKRVGVLNSIKVVSARSLLESGYTIRDRAGNVLALDTPNIDMYYCILDGQHRVDALALWVANGETTNIPSGARIELVDIPKGISIGAYIAEYNLACKKWNHRDIQSILVQTFEKEGNTVLSRMEECAVKDKMSQRGAWKIYKMNDGYRKRKYVDALLDNKLSDELRGTDAEIERGDRILRAIRVACRKETGMKRNSAIIDAIIAAYNGVADTQKIETMDLLMLFITSLTEQILAAAMKENSVSKKTEIITQAWKNFQKDIKKEDRKKGYETLALSAEEEYDQMVSKANSPKKLSNLAKIKRVLS